MLILVLLLLLLCFLQLLELLSRLRYLLYLRKRNIAKVIENKLPIKYKNLAKQGIHCNMQAATTHLHRMRRSWCETRSWKALQKAL